MNNTALSIDLLSAKYIPSIEYEDTANLPKEPGVFIVKDEQKIYHIAHAQDIRQGVRRHNRKKYFEKIENLEVVWIISPDQNSRKQLVKSCINLFSPVLNRLRINDSFINSDRFENNLHHLPTEELIDIDLKRLRKYTNLADMRDRKVRHEGGFLLITFVQDKYCTKILYISRKIHAWIDLTTKWEQQRLTELAQEYGFKNISFSYIYFPILILI